MYNLNVTYVCILKKAENLETHVPGKQQAQNTVKFGFSSIPWCNSNYLDYLFCGNQ